MIDRVIGLIGIALALLFGVLDHYLQLPAWVSYLGFGVAILLLGVCAGLLAAGGLRGKRKVLPGANLRLHVYGDNRVPERVVAENIFRWWYLRADIHEVRSDGTVSKAGSLITLFVTFEEDVIISTISIHSPDMQLPTYEVKEFNQRYAIITFMEDLPSGTLEVKVTS